MHPEQNNERGSDSSGAILTGYPWNYAIPLFTLPFHLALEIGVIPKLILCVANTNTYLCLCLWFSLCAFPKFILFACTNLVRDSQKYSMILFCHPLPHCLCHSFPVIFAMQLSQWILLLCLARRYGKKGRTRFMHSCYRKDFFITLSIEEWWRWYQKIPQCALIPLKLSPWQKLLHSRMIKPISQCWDLTPCPLTEFLWIFVRCILDTLHLLNRAGWLLSSSTLLGEREKFSLRIVSGLC